MMFVLQQKNCATQQKFFRILYPGSSAHAYLVAVASLQDILGTLNDVSVARKFACDIKARATDKRLEEGAKTISGWLEQRNQNWMLQLAPAWRTFRSNKQFWR